MIQFSENFVTIYFSYKKLQIEKALMLLLNMIHSSKKLQKLPKKNFTEK